MVHFLYFNFLNAIKYIMTLVIEYSTQCFPSTLDNEMSFPKNTYLGSIQEGGQFCHLYGLQATAPSTVQDTGERLHALPLSSQAKLHLQVYFPEIVILGGCVRDTGSECAPRPKKHYDLGQVI